MEPLARRCKVSRSPPSRSSGRSAPLSSPCTREGPCVGARILINNPTRTHDLLVSERFARAFQEEGLMELEGFHPVEVAQVRRKRRNSKALYVPPYLVVRTRPISRAAVDMARSRIVYADAPLLRGMPRGDQERHLRLHPASSSAMGSPT